MHKKTLLLTLALACAMTFAGCHKEEKEESSAISITIVEDEPAANTETEEGTEENTESQPEMTETPEEAETTDSSQTETDTQDKDMRVTMLDVGQGLSMLVESDGHYMLYDGGGRSRSSYVVAYLKEHGITELDYLVASHYDEDHIAGLVGVLNTTPVKTILCPDYEMDTKIYASFAEKRDASGAEVLHPNAGETFTLGNAGILVLQNNPSLHDANDRSIALRVSCGETDVVMTGDCEEAAESEMLASGLPLNAEVYVAGHHGSSSSSSKEFVQAVDPAYVFISCGKDNSYGHPTKKSLYTFKDMGAEIFRTDVQGEVTMETDGAEYSFSVEPTDDWTPGVYKN